MSSCRMFKALGLVNTCGEEPQPDIDAIIKEANNTAVAHFMALRQVDKVDINDKDRVLAVASKIIETDVVAHTSYVKMNVALSKSTD